MPAQHRLHAEPRRGRAAEGDHRPADEIRPREALTRLATQQEEPVAVVHGGEVHEPRAAALEQVEAPHETGQGEIGRAVAERVHRAQRLRRRRQRDLEAFGREVAAVDRDQVRRIEDRAEGLEDAQADRRHSGAAARSGWLRLRAPRRPTTLRTSHGAWRWRKTASFP